MPLRGLGVVSSPQAADAGGVVSAFCTSDSLLLVVMVLVAGVVSPGGSLVLTVFICFVVSFSHWYIAGVVSVPGHHWGERRKPSWG